MTRPFVMFGFSHLFGDIVDCIESVDGQLDRVYLNVPETFEKPGRASLSQRISRLGYHVTVENIISFRRVHPSESYVIGFSRSQADELIRHLEVGLGPCNPLTHKSAILQMGASLGPWSIVNAGAILGSWSKFGRHVIVNRGANVGHDAIVGDHCFIAPAAVLCSHVVLDEDVFVGANATILPDVHVGAGATVAAGAVVLEDVPAHTMVAGVPAVVKNAPIGA
jgi:carbonic anhydrase/acetyltransferase-like protein (isoleucine patch superfamily)